MDYIIELLVFVAPLITVPTQSKIIDIIIDTFGWRSGCWLIGSNCIKKGNIIAFIVALLSSVLVSVADVIVTGSDFSPESMVSHLGIVWFATWKYYNDNKVEDVL